MAQSNSHEGISHPFGAKHGTAAQKHRNLGDRMYPGFHDFLAAGDVGYASELWASRFAESVETVKADVRDMMRPHDEKHHAGWKPYVPDPHAPIPYCSVGARSLDLAITVPKVNVLSFFHSEHQQMICSDGENFGLTNDNKNDDVIVESKNKLPEYIISPVKYRKDIVIQARKAIDDEWKRSGNEKRYAYLANNCQHHIEKVLNKAAEIARESQKKLILD